MVLYSIDIKEFDDSDSYREALQKLPDIRREKINSMKSETARKLSLAAGFLLMIGLEEQGIDTSHLEYEKGIHGKPYLKGEGLPYFNLSHSGTRAACVIGDREMGVDIEKVRDKSISESLIRKACTPREAAYVLQLSSEQDRAESFCRLWTIKESIMKQSGMGMTMMPHEIDVYEGLFEDSFSYNGNRIDCRKDGEYYLSVCVPIFTRNSK